MTGGAIGRAREQGTHALPRQFARLAREGPARLRRAIAQAAAERRLFVILPGAAILGMVVYRMLPAEPAAAALVTIGVLLAVAGVLSRNHYAISRVLLVFAAVYAGAVILPIHGALFGTPMLDAPRYGTYQARVDALVYDNGETRRIVISDIVPDDPRGDPKVARARITLSAGPALHPGDTISARLRFYPVPGPIVPGGYDSQFVSYFDGIGAYGTVLGDAIAVTPARTSDFARISAAIRTAIGQRVLATLGDRIGGIAVALITGDQSRISEADRDLMASAGLAHVLAISGLHLTIVAGTMFAVLRFGLAAFHGVAQRVPVKRVAAAGAIVTACAYLVISGMGISAIRATVMLSLVFAAVIAGRQALTMRNVAIAAMLIIVIEPASVFRASFQLSFAAVVALIAAYELARARRDKRIEQTNRLAALFVDITMTSIIAGLATLLFTAYHFQQTAPFGVLGNLMAMPIVTFVMMPAALFATLSIPIGLDAPLFGLMGWCLQAVLWSAERVRDLSGGFDPSPILNPAALVVGLLGLSWLAFFQTPIRLVGPALAVPLVLMLGLDKAPDILIADTTQALAVRHDGHLALVAGRANTFATNVWSERYMEPITRAHDATACDAIGCILHSDAGFMLAYVTNIAAFLEDCALADIVVARIPAPPACARTTTVIDQTMLQRSGAHMAYWDASAERFTVRATIPNPTRPWRLWAQ